MSLAHLNLREFNEINIENANHLFLNRMFFGDNSSDSDDLPINYLKQERTTTSNFTEIENQLKNEIIPIPWKQIADKFWKCMLTNSKSSTTIVEFLDSLLTLVVNG